MGNTLGKFATVGFCLVGILLLVAGVVGAIAEYRFAAGVVRTTGQIVSMDPTWVGYSHGNNEGTRPRYEYRVTYRYVDQWGKSHDEQLTSYEDRYRPGAEVDVEYLADAPDRSRLAASWWVGWGWAGGLILIGVVLLAVGARLLYELIGCECQGDSGRRGS
jgi:hypothetical protein